MISKSLLKKFEQVVHERHPIVWLDAYFQKTGRY
jgi:hypothetical protein